MRSWPSVRLSSAVPDDLCVKALLPRRPPGVPLPGSALGDPENLGSAPHELRRITDCDPVAGLGTVSDGRTGAARRSGPYTRLLSNSRCDCWGKLSCSML